MYQKGTIRFNTDIPDTLEEEKLNKGWIDLHLYKEEKIARDISKSKGNGLKITTEVDADHVHDLET